MTPEVEHTEETELFAVLPVPGAPVAPEQPPPTLAPPVARAEQPPHAEGYGVGGWIALGASCVALSLAVQLAVAVALGAVSLF